MESYPAELLVGVFPLVFCADATLDSKDAANGDMPNKPSSSPSQSGRSQFDRFLDVLAASLLDETEGSMSNSMASPASKRRSHDEVMRGLFRGDEGVIDSDHEDDIILGMDGGELDPKRTRSFSKNIKFPGLGRDASFGGGGNNDDAGVVSIDSSFAKSLQEGQGFFQRARIVSISSRHGFPPSKDPTGEDNRIRDYFLGKTLRIQQVISATKRRPIDGILPSGWLEKHAAALPSVIVVVAQVTSHQRRHEQDSVLEETLKNIQISLARKRGCTIRIVGLVQEGISTQMATEWKQEMVEGLEGNPQVTLIDIADLQQDSGMSRTLKMLHRSIHEASFRYYAAQTRRTKQKLHDLGPMRSTPLLLPLAIRYCFKVAMFYEFQWKPEKSLKYLAESYRHAETYFRYLLQRREIGDDATAGLSLEGSERPSVELSQQQLHSTSGTESEGVEMSIPDASDNLSKILLNPPVISEDMIHQCRLLADWLNFKILQSCLTSHTDGGLLAASRQWRRHNQAFCNPRRSFICNPELAYVDWSFVSHQRLVASQLMERNPPRVEVKGFIDEEAILRCLPGKAYEAAAEALLRLGAEVNKRAASQAPNVDATFDNMRSRYVGGLDKNGFQPKWQEVSKVKHSDVAFDCLRRAIAFHEKQQAISPSSRMRSGARLYYLAGGILLGKKEYKEAASYLESAILLAADWEDLECKIRRLLLQCYEFYIPTVEPEQQSRLATILLAAYFKSDMTRESLQIALKKFSSSVHQERIAWAEETHGDDQQSLPISFTVTFPSTTHVRIGENVVVNVLIRSNFKHDIEIEDVDLLTSAGIQNVHSDRRHNCLDGDSADKLLLKAKNFIWFTASFKLPKDLNSIIVDESQQGLSKQKIARPQSAGMTAACEYLYLNERHAPISRKHSHSPCFSTAGTRLVAETHLDSTSLDKQWSEKCLGGRTLTCDGIKVAFCLAGSASTPANKKAIIDLVIEKRKPPIPANVKRTPFVEENYLSCAWMETVEPSFNFAPSCIRVQPPFPDMTIANVTEAATGGKALEGTVNRILLCLKAGNSEQCENVQIRRSLSSSLSSATGHTIEIVEKKSSDNSAEDYVLATNSKVRTPIMVRQEAGTQSQMTEFGYETPSGWRVLPSSSRQEDREGDYESIVDKIGAGECIYAIVDVYRPSPDVTTIKGSIQSGENEENLMYEHSICKSDIEVSIRYQQKRIDHGTGTLGEPDTVELSYPISLIWSQPLAATFSPCSKTSKPSGNRHPSNSIERSSVGPESELVLNDGERVTTRCTLEAAAAAHGLSVNIEKIRYAVSFVMLRHFWSFWFHPLNRCSTLARIYRTT